MVIWIFSGAISGLVMSQVWLGHVVKTGNFVAYDRAAKAMVLMGLLGYVLMGFCFHYQLQSFIGYIFLMIFIGAGSIGYYGLIYMSIIETFYPLSSLLIGNILIVGASFYSALASSLNLFT